MEDPYLAEEHDRDTTALALGDVCAEAAQQCFDVLPGDVCAGWMGEDCFESPLMGALHGSMVPESSTERNERGF